MDLFNETKYFMNKYNITANKNFGQNFLTDENAINSIIENSNISNEDLIIEIGPGLGTLTSYLLKKAGKVICIELDKKMIQILNDRFSSYKNFELINDDVLKVDLNSLINLNLESLNLKQAKVVANLPYYITTPIIMKLLEENLNLYSITVMVQKEVAERLAETPGGKNTGAITYSIFYKTIPEIILKVPASSFVPAPKVDSAVLKLTIRNLPIVQPNNEKLFFEIIKKAFLQKRKTLLNSLTNSGVQTKEVLEKMLTTLDLDLKVRPENLTIEDYKNIANYLNNL